MNLHEKGRPSSPLQTLEKIQEIVGDREKGVQLFLKRAEVLMKCRSYLPLTDFDIVQRAVDTAIFAHGNQSRTATGDPYMIHCLRSMDTCASHQSNSTVLATLALHDTTEDTPYALADVREDFGDVIYYWVSRLEAVRMRSEAVSNAQTAKKVVNALFPEIILPKCVERLDNYDDPKNIAPDDSEAQERRRKKAGETLEIYVSSLDVWGAKDIQDRLSDHCLRIIQPKFIQAVGQYQEQFNSTALEAELVGFVLGQLQQPDLYFKTISPDDLGYAFPSNYELYRQTGGKIRGVHLRNLVRPRVTLVYHSMDDALMIFSKLLRTSEFSPKGDRSLQSYVLEDYTQPSSGVLILQSKNEKLPVDVHITYQDYLRFQESLLWEICRFNPDQRAQQIKELKQPNWQAFLAGLEKKYTDPRQQMSRFGQEMGRAKITFFYTR